MYLKELSKIISPNEYMYLDKKITEIIKTYCINCPLHNKCFKQNRIHLYQYITSLVSDVKVNYDNIKFFLYSCSYKEEIESLEKINIKRELAKDTIFDIIDFNHNQNIIIDKLKNILNKTGYISSSVVCNSTTSISLELSFKDNYVSKNILKYMLEHKFKKKLKVDLVDNKYIITEASRIKITFDSIVLAKGNLYISGDNILIKKKNNDLYFALSDGMGSGLVAYQASKDILSKLSELIELDIDDDKMLSMLKQLYLLAGYNDSYGTLDFLHMSKSKMNCTLYKVASTSTFHLTSKEVVEYATSTLPLEIDGEITKYEINIEIGDVILLVSDGVTSFIDIDKLKDFIYSLKLKNTDRIVYELSKYIYQESNNKLLDDLSIIAIKILKN